MLEIWEECEENSKPLTPIIPIIVYHNKENRHWHYKPFSDYFKDIDPLLLPYIPKFDYELTDLPAGLLIIVLLLSTSLTNSPEKGRGLASLCASVSPW